MLNRNPPSVRVDGAVSDRTTSHQIDQSIINEVARQPERGHLGLSELGHPDIRTTWLKFRWCLPDDFTARTLRIFSLGNLIEHEVIRMLKGIPHMEVREYDPSTNRQWNAKAFGGHVAGSMDGVVVGVPEAPKTPHALEIKSAKNSEFNQAKKKGIKEWKPTYWGQIQAYMAVFKLTRALYCVYNKDTSELYFERIRPEPDVWDRMEMSAEQILNTDTPPVSRYKDRNHFEIKNFRSKDWQRIYWGDVLPLPNCRNCIHSVIETSGQSADWICNRHGHVITIEEQRAGCDTHLYLPSLLEHCATWTETLLDIGIVRYQTLDGCEFWNCEDCTPYPDAMVFDSLALCGMTQNDGLNGEFFANEELHKFRRLVDGKIRPDDYVAPPTEN